jgi:hypothetical protein
MQIKSDALWNGHQRSPQHRAKLQTYSKDDSNTKLSATAAPSLAAAGKENLSNGETQEGPAAPSAPTRKRSRDEEDEADDVDNSRKRSRATTIPGFVQQGFFDEKVPSSENSTPPLPGTEFSLPSRNATPLKTPDIPAAEFRLSQATVPEAQEPEVQQTASVDDDEWAAFEADIAETEAAAAAPPPDAVIQSAPMTAAEIEAKSIEDELQRKREAAEAEREGDKEDVARRLEEEFEEMHSLEERLKRLKAKREQIRLAEMEAMKNKLNDDGVIEAKQDAAKVAMQAEGEEEEEEDDDDVDDDDDWASFRLR